MRVLFVGGFAHVLAVVGDVEVKRVSSVVRRVEVEEGGLGRYLCAFDFVIIELINGQVYVSAGALDEEWATCVGRREKVDKNGKLYFCVA